MIVNFYVKSNSLIAPSLAVSLILLVRERGNGGPQINFYFLGGGHFKYLYLCGGTLKINKILVVVPQIIDGVPPRYFFLEKPSVISDLKKFIF